MLQVQSLTHYYKKDKAVLRDINLNLSQGIVGLLGKNGAGKSSLMNILATLQKPTQGEVLWKGESIIRKPQHLRQELGYLPQYFGVYDELTTIEFLSYISDLKQLDTKTSRSRIDTLLESLNLTHVAHFPLSSYSGGMRQRVGIAQALLNNPALLIVDEPTVGLDPEERNQFKNMLAELAADRLILLSTHIVSDIESIADSIAIMNHGQLNWFDSADALKRAAQHQVWELQVSTNRYAELKSTQTVAHAERNELGYLLKIVSGDQPDENARAVVPTLEDAYLAVNRAAQETLA
ncbi:ABC transporter ATP-binding protein [Pseudoalteromonas fenneropenaei]|uniref:ABC transporter ATP-binding protein n=1 Tax=Pseudoalteromonas fenneropenaei TaxID=1737459 RepID=A0ABV7CPY2_9GAMM